MRAFAIGCMLVVLMSSVPLLSQQVLFSETFTNGVAENTWYAGFGGDTLMPSAFEGNPGGDGWVGELGNQVSEGSVGLSFSGDINLSDFYYEAWLYLKVDEALYYGIEFRVDSTNADTAIAGYNFVARFNPAFGNVGMRFRARAGANIDSLRYWTEAEIPGGIPTENGWHKLAVRAMGNQFWLYYDDQELPGAPFEDNTYNSGFIAAYVFYFFPATLLIDDILVLEDITAIDDRDTPELVSDFRLYQNYPNPFNPNTTIAFFLPNSETVTLDIYNALGQKIRTLARGRYSPGTHQLAWDGRDDRGQVVPSGVYLYTLKTGQYTATRKMMLLR